jgi:hypothetical protein
MVDIQCGVSVENFVHVFFVRAPAQQAMWWRFWWGGIAAIFLLMLAEPNNYL